MSGVIIKPDSNINSVFFKLLTAIAEQVVANAKLSSKLTGILLFRFISLDSWVLLIGAVSADLLDLITAVF